MDFSSEFGRGNWACSVQDYTGSFPFRASLPLQMQFSLLYAVDFKECMRSGPCQKDCSCLQQ